MNKYEQVKECINIIFDGDDWGITKTKLHNSKLLKEKINE